MSGGVRSAHVADNSRGTAVVMQERCSYHADTVVIDVSVFIPIGWVATQWREINIFVVVQQVAQNIGWFVCLVESVMVGATDESGFEQWQQDVTQTRLCSEALVDIVLTKWLVQSYLDFCW